MPSLLALAMPIAMLVPFVGHGGEDGSAGRLGHAEEGAIAESDKVSARQVTLQSSPYPASSFDATPMGAFDATQSNPQIRIERRVIIRVSPRRSQARTNLTTTSDQRSTTTRFVEREMDSCVAVADIAGVQTGSGSRLLLFMRDSGMITVNLEKACRARDFYAGFYVEKSADGKLCVDRDKLQSRSGAKCEVERMRELVAVRD